MNLVSIFTYLGIQFLSAIFLDFSVDVFKYFPKISEFFKLLQRQLHMLLISCLLLLYKISVIIFLL